MQREEVHEAALSPFPRARLAVLLIGLGVVACTTAVPPLSTALDSGAKSAPETPSPHGANRPLGPLPGSLDAILDQEDTDGDRRITKLDQGPRRFNLQLTDGTTLKVSGTYHLANLVQELYLNKSDPKHRLSIAHIFEAPTKRISRLIRQRYWKGLTRSMSPELLEQVLKDPKTDTQRRIISEDEPWPNTCTHKPKKKVPPRFLYVPHSDRRAFDYYAALTDTLPFLVVCRLPALVTPKWVSQLNASEKHGSRHGLLSLALAENTTKAGLSAVPYVVPGGRFNELYGWDTYFQVIGLLIDGKHILATQSVENQLYEVLHYGKVLNANRTYYLNRSQPPLLPAAVRALWQSKTRPSQDWLHRALSVLTTEYRMWNSPPRRTELCARRSGTHDAPVCLSRYHAEGLKEPPEVEAGHFDWLYNAGAARLQLTPRAYRDDYKKRNLPPDELKRLDTFFLHDRSMRESGHDTTYRFYADGSDRTADFASIDLNSLLFRYELDLAYLSHAAGAEFSDWCLRAQARKELMLKHLYDGTLFFDARLTKKGGHTSAQLSGYLSATTLFPLWASVESPCRTPQGRPLRLMTQDQAERLVSSALRELEAPGGLAATSQSSRERIAVEHPRQWDYPFGWAPHQILAWQGMKQFGFKDRLLPLVYRWLYMITQNAYDFHGTIPEKYDVEKRSHRVFAEYGNVGTDFSYITEEGFGWMNASYQIGLGLLPASLRAQLDQLVAPEKINFASWSAGPRTN